MIGHIVGRGKVKDVEEEKMRSGRKGKREVRILIVCVCMNKSIVGINIEKLI